MDLHPKVTVKIVHTNWIARVVGYRDPKLTGYYNLELDKLQHAPTFSILSQIDIIELTPHQVRFAASDYVHDLSFFIRH